MNKLQEIFSLVNLNEDTARIIPKKKKKKMVIRLNLDKTKLHDLQLTDFKIYILNW